MQTPEMDTDEQTRLEAFRRWLGFMSPADRVRDCDSRGWSNELWRAFEQGWECAVTHDLEQALPKLDSDASG